MFQFKRFGIDDVLCAQKVGTDSVLLGAWAVIPSDCKIILDVGTGSGLLSLMLAQRTLDDTHIHAIDMDEQAIKQAQLNFNNTDWKNRLTLQHTSLQAFTSEKKFDLIISNPPYFENALKSNNNQRNIARHTDSLSLQEIFTCSANLLHAKGILSIIIPYQQLDIALSLAANYLLVPVKTTKVKGNKTANYKRVLISFCFQKEQQNFKAITDELIIEVSRNVYTEDYNKLTKDFYLNF